MIQLFTYGTLQHDDVQENLFGRVLTGTPEKLIGYVLKRIQIEEEFGIVQYPVIVETNNEADFIDGIVYELTEQELNQADLYEGLHYKRVEVHLHSNQKAWAYSSADFSHY
ncbi:MAG TPA: gamma-glutamylcyclotransferase [Flavobacterium alvei]|nr:gamma-glutamylcyclotransferase [Flavobacterium alvei]HQK41072.1 gamma-glutamylcyclotransferase [Flavobacterium alvei]